MRPTVAAGNKRTIQTDWESTWRKPTERRTYNSAGTLVAKTDWTYNSRGQQLTVTQTDPATGAMRTTSTSYCEAADLSAGTCPILGLVKSIDGPRTDVSDVTTYTYYQTDDSTCATAPTTCPHRKGDLQQITNALGQTTHFIQYDGAGRLLASTDVNGVETDLSYNARGWLTQRALRGGNPNTTTDDYITNYQYDYIGQITQLTTADGAYTTFSYDTAHRLTDIAQKDAGNNLIGTIHYTLDAAGNRIQEDTKDPSSTVTRSLARQFNLLGQLAATLNADHTTANASYTYDANGNVSQVTDGRGTVTTSTYDPLDRLSHVTQDPGTIPAHVNANIVYSYDALDRLTQVTDPQGLNTSYQYDGFGDQTQLSSPDTGTTTYTYDSAGNRASQTDARGTLSTYTYDALNRVTGISYPTSSYDVSYGYDTVETGCPTGQVFAIGRMTHYIDASGSTAFCFDRYGEMAHKMEYVLAAMYTTGDSLFDKMSRPLEFTEPKNTIVDYTRDGIGRITGITYQINGQPSATTLISNVTYYPFGPVKTITYGSGIGARTLTRTYDQDYVIQSVKDPDTDGLDLNYSRDVLGNLTQIENSAGTIVGNQYVYDALNRLTYVNDINSNPIAAYTYDSTGNRLSKTYLGTTTAYTYPTNSHRLQAVGSTSRTYDAKGDTASIGTGALSFLYDETGRMSQVLNAGVQQKIYNYDARGQRVRKVQGTAIAKTIFDEQGHILGDFDSGNNIIDEMIWMDDLPVGVINGSATAADYIEPDHLGTPRAVIDPARNLAVWKWPMLNDAFGETQPNQDPDGDGTAFTLNLRFPGQEWDAESGMSYNYFRDYDSSTGRYVESDPIGLKGGVSTFSYVYSRPLFFMDPHGLFFTITNLCPTCINPDDPSVQENFRANLQSKCNNLGNNQKLMKNVDLFNCMKDRCNHGIVQINCSGRDRGDYTCPSDRQSWQSQNGGWVEINLHTVGSPASLFKSLSEMTDSVLHEWAHSCNWTHGDGLGIPHDPGNDGTPKCRNEPTGTEQ